MHTDILSLYVYTFNFKLQSRSIAQLVNKRKTLNQQVRGFFIERETLALKKEK